MDARAYLTQQGWRGSGHSLDKHDRGIKKPLLISHKQDTMGLGTKKAAHKTDDQWWMRAFDESLKNIGTGQESTLSQVRKVGINRGGLYGFFVKGEGLQGTVGETLVSPPVGQSSLQSSTSASRQSTPPTSIDSETPADRSSKKKRKRDEEARKEDSKRQKEDNASTKETNSKKRKRDEPISNPTCDFDPEKIRRVWLRIDHEVNAQIKRDERAGRFLAVPSKNTDRVPDPGKHGKPGKPGKTLSFKQARLRKQKDMRAAAAKLRREMAVDAMMAGELPNPKGYTSREKALRNFDKDAKALKKDENRKKRSAQQDKKKAEKASKSASAANEDIKTLKKAGIPKKGSAQQDKTKGEKAPKSASGASEDSEAIVAAKIAKLTASEKSKYQERANAKNQTLEQYVLRRITKKSEKKQGADSSSRSTTGTPLPVVTDVQSDKKLVATVSEAEKPKKKVSSKKAFKAVKVRAEVAVAA